MTCFNIFLAFHYYVVYHQLKPLAPVKIACQDLDIYKKNYMVLLCIDWIAVW